LCITFLVQYAIDFGQAGAAVGASLQRGADGIGAGETVAADGIDDAVQANVEARADDLAGILLAMRRTPREQLMRAAASSRPT
jgi:hypothetical protein